jgi:hypothetical protein
VTRKVAKYANRRGAAARRAGPSFDADLPVTGCYLVRLVRGGPPCALRIWFGLPLDPVTGEELDRAPVWLARVNGGQPRPASWFWPECARTPISQAEHDRLVQQHRTMNPADPFFDPLRPIDRLKTPVPF